MICQHPLEVAFGQVVRALRKQKAFSQEELAALCNLDRTFISLLERGKRQPSLKTIFIISRALSLPSSELIRLVEAQTISGDSSREN